MTDAQALATLLKKLRNDATAFNKHLLGRVHPSLPAGYWPKQVEVLDAVLRHRKVVVPSGHGTGKSFLATGAALHFAYTRPNSRVILCAPSWQQLKDVLWAELVHAWKNARIKLPGEIKSSQGQLQLQITEKWGIWGSSADTKSPESLAGRHAGDMLVICDESSWNGYDEVIETLESFNASNYLFIGNPLRNGRFRQLCDQADGETINKIHISSTDSPHAHLPRSPVGLADAGFLSDMRKTYGEDHPVYKSRVLGLFNETDEHTLIPASWMKRCDFTLTDEWKRQPHGDVIIAVDLAGGNGGDDAVILVRNRDQILDMKSSKNWSYPNGLVEQVKALAQVHKVDGSRIIYDKGGLGLGFSEFLSYAGLPGAYGYIGGSKGNRFATNFRGCCALQLRDRLDPDKNQPFHIPRPILDVLSSQIGQLRYSLNGGEQIKLEEKGEMAKRLNRSPDHLDCWLVSMSKGL